MKTIIESDDLVAAIRSGDLSACALIVALSAWIDCKEEQGYDTKVARRHLAELTDETADMPWVGRKPAPSKPAAKCPMVHRANRPTTGYGRAPYDPYRQ